MTTSDILLASAGTTLVLTVFCFVMSKDRYTSMEDVWFGLGFLFAIATIWLGVAA